MDVGVGWCWYVFLSCANACEFIRVHPYMSRGHSMSQSLATSFCCFGMFWNGDMVQKYPEKTRERGVQLYHSDRFGSGSIP